MSTTSPTNTAEPEALPRVLSLTEAAARLKMKPPNVAKFLARRGVKPVLSKAQGYFWSEDDIERVKAAREQDTARMASDRRRRRGALQGHAASRLGQHQLALLPRLLRTPLTPATEAERHALRRLRERGLVKAVRQGRAYELTPAGRELAVDL